jgi:Na+-transporting NADH:ubiquinone oxidoreductase subunit B
LIVSLRSFLDQQAKHFEPGGKLEKLHALWEAQDTILYSPGKVTTGPSHVRDGLDLKRMMMTVVIALIPAIAMAMYNTGYQAHLAISRGAEPLARWQTSAMQAMGLSFDPGSLWACVVHGSLYFFPVLIVTFAAGGFWEVLFASVRRHEVNEGFFVTGFLFPLILPATIPLWQVALGISFGVVLGKEIFGGTGMNFLNPALLSRAFLFFAYPIEISGDAVWIAAKTSADGVSGATWLAVGAEQGQAAVAQGVRYMDAFWGLIPGSMGETSALACLIGAVILILTGVGSWRIMAGVAIGTVVMAAGLNAIGSDTNPFFATPFWWHFVLGGWAFGTVFMATDPVSAAQTDKGRWIYGVCIGVLVVLVRVVNPAYPEGMMLAILLMNVMAPLIDHYVIASNVKRRRARYAT